MSANRKNIATTTPQEQTGRLTRNNSKSHTNKSGASAVTLTPSFTGRSSSIISTDCFELLERKLMKNQRILEKVSSCIDHTLSPYSTAFRIKSSSQRSDSSKTSPIVIKFSCISEKDIFLQKYKHHGAVTLNQISPDFISDSRVNVFESLTRINQQVLRRALWLKRSKSIHSAFTRQGLVHVCIKLDDSPIVVTSVDALNQILSEANSGA